MESKSRIIGFLIGLVLIGTACSPDVEPLRQGRGENPQETTVQEPSQAPSDSSSINWSAYLFGPTHSSRNSNTKAITATNASDLTEEWQWAPEPPSQEGQPPSQLFASPTVFDGTVYIGVNSGDFYALDEATGTVRWKRFLGFLEQNESCGRRGTTSTATVAEDPKTGEPTVYVGAADGNLYALNAASGDTRWKSFVVSPQEDGHNWSSPTVMDGRVYVGVASHCKSTVRGGVKEYDQATGRLLETYWTVPKGVIGGSVWSSVAAASNGKSIFVSTGNGDLNGGDPGDSFSVVRLKARTLTKEDIWTAPLEGTDLDFGASPTLFSARINDETTPMVGACNKNGRFYAFRQKNLSAGPAWEVEVSGKWPNDGNCLGAAIWDSDRERLFVSGAQTTVDGKSHRGSIREVNPATGAFLWELGLPGVVWGSPSMNGNNIIAVPSFDTDPSAERAVWLIDANDGSMVETLDTADNPVFSQPVFADNYLFVATVGGGLIAYKLEF